MDGAKENSAAARLFCAVIVAVRHSMPMTMLDSNQVQRYRWSKKYRKLVILTQKLLWVRSCSSSPQKSPNSVFSNQISKKGEVFAKEVFPATEFAVGLFPSFSRLRAASKKGSKDDDEPDAFWFFQDGKIIMQASAHKLLLKNISSFT